MELAELLPCGRYPAAPAALVKEWPADTLPGTVGSYVAAAISDNTRRAYRGDLTDFLHWGGTIPCTPTVLAAYLADQAPTHSPHTIARRLVGISRAHLSQGFADPARNDLVRTVLRGVRRQHGRPQRQAAPLLIKDLFTLLPVGADLKSQRDRALILTGFAAALRRSELVALDVRDIAFVDQGMVLTLRRSKTDQAGVGRKIGVPFGRPGACPVRAVAQWIGQAHLHEGAVFRGIDKRGVLRGGRLTAQSVTLIVKARARAAGLDPSTLSAHSLRAGLVTSAARAGIPSYKIQQQTGHRSLEMLARYIRDASLFDQNAASVL
ncbi:site-specific integrase [Burkholderia vietnamiensis]|uniref:site-specific integrase n=1 Tax=Burkholderia vietnamiensis TaxID=60552 RepID=UPI001EE519B6|nr:site-specific integrase [Burkholderia vietnamiensis]UKV76428.1 site-specific integrase [Burkholderia vietnamiensis]